MQVHQRVEKMEYEIKTIQENMAKMRIDIAEIKTIIPTLAKQEDISAIKAQLPFMATHADISKLVMWISGIGFMSLINIVLSLLHYLK